MSRRTRLLALVLGLAMAGTAGCGVQTQREAQSLPIDNLPGVGSTPAPSPTATSSGVYFVSGRNLTRVEGVRNDRTAEGVLGALAAGPPLERETDLRTLINDPLSGLPMLAVTSVSPSGEVVLARSEAFTFLPATDQVLLVGQVVRSLDDIGLRRTVITDEAGLPVPLVLPDGRVLEGPARASDYESLVKESG